VNKLHIEKDAKTGRLNIKGLAVWSTGTFHGYGSPPEGDQFTVDDLKEMARAHEAVGAKIRPRIYAGHKLNPWLKLLARPKGEIVRLYVDEANGRLLADIDGVDPAFWEKATQDGARLSPDVKFGYTDPKTGQHFDKVIVGLGVLGAAHPANPELPPVDEYVANYYTGVYGEGSNVHAYVAQLDADGGIRSFGAPADVPVDRRDDIDAPDSVYLDPENKKYPVKRKVDGEWKYSKKDLQDAIRLANMHGESEIAKKAEGIMKREFGGAMGNDTNPKGGEDKSYAAPENKEEVMAKEKDSAPAVNDTATNNELDEQLRQFAAELKAEREARLAAEAQAKEAAAKAEAVAAILEAKMIDDELNRVSSFVDGLVQEMRLAPAAAEPMKKFLTAAAGVGGKVSSYALGDLGDDGEKSLVELAMEALNALPVPEGVSKSLAATEKATSTPVAKVHNYAYDAEAAAALRERVDAYRKEHPEVSYRDAMNKVLAESE